MEKIYIEPDLFLLPPHPALAPALFDLITTNKTHLGPWMPWLPFVKQLDDTESFLQGMLDKTENNQGILAIISYKQNLVGVVSLDEMNWADSSAKLGYWVAHDAQGQGLVTKSARAVIDYGFCEMGLNKIIVRCAVENDKSLRVINRLGFTQEGILRQNEKIGDVFYDHAAFSMLRSEWIN